MERSPFVVFEIKKITMTLYEAIFERHSVRSYIDQPLAEGLVSELNAKIQAVNNESGLHAQLVLGEPKAFNGIKSYGVFRGVSNYIVMAGKREKELDQKVGYYGEELVLFAQTLGLNTCWVGLTYSRTTDAFTLAKDEKVACVIALGYGKTQGAGHKIKTAGQVSNVSADTPEWFRCGVEAALLAPTAVNQQKFYFEYLGSDGGVETVAAQKRFSLFGYTNMDLGIAMRHFELGAGNDTKFKWVFK